MHSRVAGRGDFTGVSLGLVGGGALLVVGSSRAGGATVTVTDSVFFNNSATVTDTTPADPFNPSYGAARPDRGEELL